MTIVDFTEIGVKNKLTKLIYSYTNSKIKTQKMVEAILDSYWVIDQSYDPLKYLHQDLKAIDKVGTVCAHGIGSESCPFISEDRHDTAKVYAFNPPDSRSEPDPDKIGKPTGKNPSDSKYVSSLLDK